MKPARQLTVTALALALVAAPSNAQTRDECAGLRDNVRNHIVNTSDGGRERTIRLDNADCRLEVRLRGDIAYTPDFRGISSISRGGSFRLEEDSDDGRRQIDLASDGRGGVSIDFRVNRDARAFDAAAQNWLADRLLLLYRRAGLAAAERAEWIYQTGGLDAVLREAAQVTSSSGRTAYVTTALSAPDADRSTVLRVLSSELPSSSSARTRILSTIADRHLSDARVSEAYLDAVAETSSSSSQRELLERPMSDGRASAAYVIGALHTTSDVSSSSARVSVLRTVASQYAMDDAMLGAWLDAARQISSSSGQRDVLRTVLSQRLTDARLARVLSAVGGISSSSAQGDILVEVARSRELAGEARRVYVDVASDISSSSQRARVFEALERGPAGR